MQFKIGETHVKISFSFFALILFYFLGDYKKILVISLVVSAFHELVHLVFLLIFRCKILKFNINVFGGNIIRKQVSKASDTKEIIINLSAPLFNILAGIIIHIIKPNNLWGQVNIVLGIFNILPFFNFDGGMALKYFCMHFLNEKVTDDIISAVSFIIILIFTLINVKLAILNKINISVIVLNMYFISVFVYKIFKNTHKIV